MSNQTHLALFRREATLPRHVRCAPAENKAAGPIAREATHVGDGLRAGGRWHRHLERVLARLRRRLDRCRLARDPPAPWHDSVSTQLICVAAARRVSGDNALEVDDHSRVATGRRGVVGGHRGRERAGRSVALVAADEHDAAAGSVEGANADAVPCARDGQLSAAPPSRQGALREPADQRGGDGWSA